jgi:hypothetical protein
MWSASRFIASHKHLACRGRPRGCTAKSDILIPKGLHIHIGSAGERGRPPVHIFFVLGPNEPNRITQVFSGAPGRLTTRACWTLQSSLPHVEVTAALFAEVCAVLEYAHLRTCHHCSPSESREVLPSCCWCCFIPQSCA